ncbi:dimethylaniline monooxygenase (N-oxide forming) / hypotaurine monooxygenase, partial [Tremellales sp. Uapishka_1]
MSAISKEKVAVIGLGNLHFVLIVPAAHRFTKGTTGLAALKNLLEQGFDAVGLERNDYIGGIWQFNEDTNRTSVLKSVDAYPTAQQYLYYIRAYADHYDLGPHIRLGVEVSFIQRSADGQAWELKLIDADGARSERYNKLLVCTGPWNNTFTPRYENQEGFKGEVISSKAYKGPDKYSGKNVVVVGMANTGCDVAVDLVGSAKQVYLSHRAGARIMPRNIDGKPVDHGISRRLFGIVRALERYLPSLGAIGMAHLVESRMKKMFPEIKPEWRLLPAPPFANAAGVINDHIMGFLADGSVTSLGGIKRFHADGIETAEEGRIPCDVVILCTGSYFDYSILSSEADPTSRPTPEWDNAPHNNGVKFPRLYQTIFPPQFADSLAFLGPCKGHSFSSPNNADLASQAIAQVWKSNYALPSKAEMEKWCDRNYKASLHLIQPWRTPKTGHTTPGALETWLSDAAGNGMNEMLGWGWPGWKFWWKERDLYSLIMTGLYTPFAYRLFDGRPGGRKRWPEAREWIYKINGKADATR